MLDTLQVPFSPETVQRLHSLAKQDAISIESLVDRAVQVYARVREIGNARSLARLTRRQQEVLLLIGAGLCQKEIAMKLGISVKTVDFHSQNLMKSLEAASRAELVRYGIRLQLLGEPP